MSRAELQWIQFRRLLLGTVIEALLAEGAALEFASIAIAFDPKRSRFDVPRFNNYMRFAGQLTADLVQPLEAAASARVERGLLRAWDELLRSIELPVGDKLTNEKSEVRVTCAAGTALTVAFDLEAD